MDTTRWIKVDTDGWTQRNPFLAYKCAYCPDTFGTCRSRHDAVNHLDKVLEYHEDHCPKDPGCGVDSCIIHAGD